MIEIEFSNRQRQAVDAAGLDRAVRAVLEREGVTNASISLAIVDDQEIHGLNRQFLDHDYPTDVLSFIYEQQPLEGELIVSACRARAVANDYGWSAADELMLYVVHGALHLVGYDDQTPVQRSKMRDRELEVLDALGIRVPEGRTEPGTVSPAPPAPPAPPAGRSHSS